VPGSVRAFIDRDGDLPQYRLEIDRAAAARYGLNVMDVQDVVETALAGKAATELWEGDRHFSVVVAWMKSRASSTAQGHPGPDPVRGAGAAGQPGRLQARQRRHEHRPRIRAARRRHRRLHPRPRHGQRRCRHAEACQEIKLPTGYSITWSGEFENQERAMKRLMLVVPLSILLIFVLLFDAFKSFRDALIIISNIPFALIGGIFALLLTGIPLSVSAAIGFIALFGQAVLNGVVMVSYIKQLQQQGMDKPTRRYSRGRCRACARC
jgi:cobalt-zinc-cadmium resistance protein CzcA